MIKIFENANGVTVRELKAWLADVPDERPNGEPTQVWLETGWCVSNPCRVLSPLNERTEEDGRKSCDVILEYGAK
jgi:hypothetical protein